MVMLRSDFVREAMLGIPREENINNNRFYGGLSLRADATYIDEQLQWLTPRIFSKAQGKRRKGKRIGMLSTFKKVRMKLTFNVRSTPRGSMRDNDYARMMAATAQERGYGDYRELGAIGGVISGNPWAQSSMLGAAAGIGAAIHNLMPASIPSGMQQALPTGEHQPQNIMFSPHTRERDMANILSTYTLMMSPEDDED